MKPTVTYTGFDKARKIKQGNDSICYTYGYDHQRIFMEEHIGNTVRTKRYVGNCEYVTETEGNTVTEYWLTYLTGPTGVYAVAVTKSGTSQTHYILKDNLGSWTTIADSEGVVEQRLSYDAWGNLRNPNTWSGSFTGVPMFDRGFTGHEHLYNFDLINMNGRLYDPILGRMLSPDVVIQDEQSSQAYNRYSYCFNNPLRFTDPSGYVVRGARDYYDWSSMTYYDFGRFKNKGSAFNTDLSEGKFSPIYDVNGYFLGTDDEGIQGDAIVMRREDFKQGMSHEDALAVATELDDNNEDAEIRFFTHYSQLSNRPDWDGIITDLEAREWWRNGDGRPLYVKQSAINLSPLSTKSFDGKSSITHNFFFDINSDKDIGRVYGTLTLHLINPNTGEVKLGNINTAYIDTYDFNPGGSVLRNMATWGARILVGDGTPFNIYGWGDNPKVKVKLKWKQ